MKVASRNESLDKVDASTAEEKAEDVREELDEAEEDVVDVGVLKEVATHVNLHLRCNPVL